MKSIALSGPLTENKINAILVCNGVRSFFLAALIICFEVTRFAFILFMLPVIGEKFQVLKTVIRSIVINMMNNLRPFKGASSVLSHYQTMLHNVTIFAGHTRKLWRAADILDTRGMIAFTVAIGNATLPGWIIWASHLFGSFLSALWRGYKLWLWLSFLDLRLPFVITYARAKMMLSTFLPSIGFEEMCTTYLTNRIRVWDYLGAFRAARWLWARFIPRLEAGTLITIFPPGWTPADMLTVDYMRDTLNRKILTTMFAISDSNFSWSYHMSIIT